MLGRGELHAAAATVHGGAGALVVARASKRAARTSGARARGINGKARIEYASIRYQREVNEDWNHVPGPRRA